MDEKREEMDVAKQLEDEEKWNEAANCYVNLISDNTPTSLYERASWCLSRAGRYSEAVIYLRILTENDPASAKWPYMVGYQYYCQKMWKESVEWFELSIKRFPDYFVVKYRIAYAYVQIAGEYKKLTKAEYWKALGHLKDCHLLWNSFDESKKRKERSVYFDINFLHGKILMELPEHRVEAILLFLKALEIKPDDEFTKYNLAKSYYLNGDFKKAKESLPLSTKYYVVELSAFIEAKLENYSKAISAINKLLLKRKRDYLFAFLAEVNLLINENDDAYKLARKAVAEGPKNHKNYFLMAKIYYRYGLLRKALDFLNLANKIKKEKYGSDYQESDSLREEIFDKISPSYQDDNLLLKKLDQLAVDLPDKNCLGVIRNFNSEKGFGFIKSTPNDIFFHISNCKYTGITIGDHVQYTVVSTEKGLMAIDVCKLD